MTTRTVLVVEHEAGAPAAWLGDWLLEAGVSLDVCRPYAGDAVPADLSGYAGLLVLGGSMDSWDDAGYPWLPATRSLVRIGEASGVPVLGICLGHQLAAAALGGVVGRNPAGGTLALRPVAWVDEAATDPVFGPLGDCTLAVHWNDDVVLELPERATALAFSPDGTVQAARLGRSVWGVQFHPEVGPDLLGAWVTEDGAAYSPRGIDLAGFVADVRDHEAQLRASWRGLAGSFAAVLGDVGLR